MTNEQRTFDWRPNWDSRNRLFRFAALDCYAGGKHRLSSQRTKKVYLDQGSEGACTGFGAAHVMALTPRSHEEDNASARNLYYEARVQDEWPGEDYEGSSVNGAMKALRSYEQIRAWHWCISIDEVLHALSFHGAVEAGTYWYDGMWSPDGAGFLHPTGEVVGGHAWALSGYKYLSSGLVFRMENSWGQGWGQNGGAWLKEEDLYMLMQNEGEFACPVKVAP